MGVNRHHRRAGLGHALLTAAVAFAAERGAAAVEGYPVDASAGRAPSGDLFTGTVSQFAGAGFATVGEPGGKRIVMRRAIICDPAATSATESL